jgi:CheY-like chemotaxis protein
MNSRHTVLVVDDDPDIQESVRMVLESAGYRVVSAFSGRECMERLEEGSPDAVVMDVMMESLVEGFSTSYDIKSNPAFCKIPLILFSAIEQYTGFPVDKKFIGADDYISKPARPEALLSSVDRCFKR